jgi:hypothetical protein
MTLKLPKISYPTLNIDIPPNPKKYMFRPILVKEEKLLLMAKNSGIESDVFSTIKQVVNLCSIDPSFEVDKLPLFSLEYIFLKLRAFSISEEIKVSYKDLEDDRSNEFTINLKEVTIRYPEATDNKIAINDKAGLVMKYPTAEVYDEKEFMDSDDSEKFYRLVVRCVDQVYDGDNVYEGRDFAEEDLLEFLEMIDVQSFEKIINFMNNVPTLYYKLSYKNSLGSDRTIELTTLSDFFTLL